MKATQYKKIVLSPRFMLPLVAVLSLIVGFVVYYFVIIAQQEASLDDRAFKSLAAVSSQFKDLVNTYAIVLQQRGAGISLGKQVPELADVETCQTPAWHQLPSLNIATVARDSGYSLELASKDSCVQVSFDRALSPMLGEPLDQIFDEVFLTNQVGIVLYQTERSGIVADDLSFLSWRSEGSGLAAQSSVPTQTGEQNKTENSSAVVQTAGKAGAAAASRGGTGTLAEKDSTEFARAGASSAFSRVTLAGTEYRAYLVPLRLPVPGPSASGPGESVRLVLCGLIRQGHFSTQSRSVPVTVLTGVSLAGLLAIVAAWPLLKFATMRRTEQISAHAGLNYVLCSAAAVILMTLFIIHLEYGFRDPNTDASLQNLAAAIDRNFGKELNQVLLAMESVGVSLKLKHPEFRVHAQRSCLEPDDKPTERELKPMTTQHDLLSNEGMQVAEYPYFNRFFVYDSQGFEQVRWTVSTDAPPPLRVCDRPYFNGVQRNDLWYLSKDGLNGHRFRVDPMYSKSTGEYFAAVAEPYNMEGRGKRAEPSVMMMVAPLLSLMRPVLPPDYGFAVIDQSGKVLFHSNPAKNGRENFFDQSRNSIALRTAVLAQRPTGRLTMNYLGADYRTFVTPFTKVQQCPWTLIVFSDRTVLADKQLERILVAAMLAIMYFVFVALFALVLRRVMECDRLVWPRDEQRGCYYHLALALGIVLSLAYVLAFQASPNELLLLVVLVPVSSLVFVILKLNSNSGAIVCLAIVLGVAALFKDALEVHPLESPYLSLALICAAFLTLGLNSISQYFNKWTRLTLASAFSLSCLALLVLVAGWPCIAFFKLSFDHDEYLSTKRDQLLTIVALEKREQRVIDQYLPVRISREREPYGDDVGKWLFLRRRLQDQTLDLYDKELGDQGQGQIFSPAGANQWPTWFDRLAMIATDLVPSRPASLTERVVDKSADGKWVWLNEGANRVHMQRTYQSVTIPGAEGSVETIALAKVALRDPIFMAQGLTYEVDLLQPWGFLGVIVPCLVLLVLGFWSIRLSMRKMFLLDMKMRQGWTSLTLKEAMQRDRNTILIGLPCSGKTEMLRQRAQEIAIIDLATPISGDQLEVNPIKDIVALDHFEFGIADDSVNGHKLNLLEELVFRKQKKVIIVTTIDPEYYFENAGGDPPLQLAQNAASYSDRGHWMRVLSRFDVVQIKGGSEPMSRFYHPLLWATCTWSEKTALHTLAGQGWANCKSSEDLSHLWKRGLIKRDPAFSLADANFGEYISGNVSSQERKSWELWDNTGLWDGLRTALIVLLLAGVAAIFFFSQKDTWGIITTILSAVTGTTKLISTLRGPPLPGTLPSSGIGA